MHAHDIDLPTDHEYPLFLRKAAKALLVLTPLLGLTYVLLLVAPESGPGRLVVTYLHALVFSTQVRTPKSVLVQS